MDATTVTARGSRSSAAALNCSLCDVSFPTKEGKREHMKDSWHVYNLKRRLTSLPPISLSVFQTQIVEKDEASEEDKRFRKECKVCQQTYSDPKAWSSHLKSRNHTLKAAGYESNSETVSLPTKKEDRAPSKGKEVEVEYSEDDDEGKSSGSIGCLFCSSDSSSTEHNLTHMDEVHNFSIPDPEGLIDIDCFLKYLNTIISQFHECIFCGIEKEDAEQVREHMREKEHCRIVVDEKDELGFGYGIFWGVDGSEESDGDENEDEDDLEAEDLDGKTIEGLVLGDGEMRLPSGKILGSRSSRPRGVRNTHITRSPSPSSSLTPSSHTPRTSLHPTSSSQPESSIPSTETAASSSDRRLVVRAGTETSLIGVPERQQRALRAIGEEMLKMEMKKRNEYQGGLERRGNKQKRFRVKSMGKKQGGLEKRLG